MDSWHAALANPVTEGRTFLPHNLVMLLDRLHDKERMCLAAGIACGHCSLGSEEEKEACIKKGHEVLAKKAHDDDTVRLNVLPTPEIVATLRMSG